MDSLFDALSLPYVFPREGVFALGIGVLIIGLLLFRFSLARRRDDRPDRNG